VQLEGADKEKINTLTHIIVCITVLVSSASKCRNNVVTFIRIYHMIRWFLNLKKAVAAVRRKVLYNIVNEFGIPITLVGLMRMWFK
jgi:hypothetical protein